MSEANFTKKMEIGITTDGSPFCIDGFCNVDGERFEVCSVWGLDDDTVACEQSKANAHLIAVAPEMYAEIEKDIAWLDRMIVTHGADHPMTPVFADMKQDKISLLAKARGES